MRPGASVVAGEPQRSSGSRGLILHVINRYIPYGASRNLQFVLEWEKAYGYEPHLAVGGQTQFQLPNGVVAHSLPSLRRDPSAADDLRSLVELRRLVGVLAPTVVQTHQSKAGILGRLAARGRVPVVIHTIHMPSFGFGYGRAASAAYQTLERRCARYTDLFVPVGRELEQMYTRAGIGRDRQYSVIHSYVELDRFFSARSATPAQRLEWRSRHGLPANGRVVVAAGLLEKRKRVELIVRRLLPLLTSGQAVLVIAGDGPKRRAIEHLVHGYGVAASVVFAGFVSKLEELLGLADVLVHASMTEGIPQVVLQAAAVATPVVATDMVGLREIPGNAITVVDRDGVNLLDACVDVLSRPKPPGPAVEEFDPWSAGVVGDQLRALHERVAAQLSGRPNSGR
jgi:glycosyltransferase involved in cell wall biosynthesis